MIEVLSPWNKLPGNLNRRYIKKLHGFEDAGTNWVEIDLLRSTRNRLIVTWNDLPKKNRADYLIVTCRIDEEKVSAYPISVRDRLANVMIPLRDSDCDISLDLQSIFESVYDVGSFRSIDYTKLPAPPLSSADAEWAVGSLLRNKLSWIEWRRRASRLVELQEGRPRMARMNTN